MAADEKPRGKKVSIHALLAECDSILITGNRCDCSFNPRTPCGVRHASQSVRRGIHQFQSTHSLRSATAKLFHHGFFRQVSIHALLAECDCRQSSASQSGNRFNPRTPCGVRHGKVVLNLAYLAFQSTHSLRSATMDGGKISGVYVVSIHALLAECDRASKRAPSLISVSIHALLAECDSSVLSVLRS